MKPLLALVLLSFLSGLFSRSAYGADEPKIPPAPGCDLKKVCPPAPWFPPNKTRNQNEPHVTALPPEYPGFLDATAGLTREGVVFKPNEKFQAAFNPAAWKAIDPADGREKVYLMIRGELEQNDKEWKRQSLPYLAVSEDGITFRLVSESPVLKADQPYENQGGLEDFRFADLALKPVEHEGKVYEKALYYTAFDGKTARICLALFNDWTDIKKVGPIFRDEDVLKNPSVPGSAWNKSPAFIQYVHRGKVRQVGYFNEGNSHHGGIWAAEITDPRNWPYPTDRAIGPVIKARPGFYDQNLVEPAFQPVIGPLSKALSEKTGQKQGIYLPLHGDSPPRGYQLGYRVFSLEDPTGPPIYESSGAFFWPEKPYEIDGQVDKVVFMSSAVQFKGKWHFYYGAGDRVIGLATGKPAGTK